MTTVHKPFNQLPLGTAFRYIGGNDKKVYVVIENYGIGSVAEHKEVGPDYVKSWQSMYCFQDDEHPMDTLVEVVPLITSL